MNKPVSVSGALSAIAAPPDEETVRLATDLATGRGRSVAPFAAEAIQRVTESAADVDAFVQEGIDALDRGGFVEHEVAMAALDDMIAAHQARCG